MIFSDTFINPVGELGLEIEPGWIQGELSLEEAKQNLLNMGLDFIENQDRYDQTIIHLQLKSGVKMSFEESIGLSAFNHKMDLPEDKPQKQISLSVPEDSYLLIKKIALKEKISISNLCRNWILDKCNENKEQI